MKSHKKLDKHVIYLDELIHQVAREMKRPNDYQYAFTTIEAVLKSVRNRLTFEQSVKFLSLLPLPFKAVYIKDWSIQDHTPDRINSMKEFINEVCTIAPELNERGYNSCDLIRVGIRSVFTVIGLHVSKKNLEKELSFLPKDLRLYLEAQGVAVKSNAMLSNIWLS